MNKRILSVWLAAVFIAGLGIGIVGARAIAQFRGWKNFREGPDAVRNHMVSILARELSLSSDQLDRIKPVAFKFQRRFIEIRLKSQPELLESLDGALEELRPILDEPQWQRVKRHSDELKSRWLRDVDWIRAAK